MANRDYWDWRAGHGGYRLRKDAFVSRSMKSYGAYNQVYGNRRLMIDATGTSPDILGNLRWLIEGGQLPQTDTGHDMWSETVTVSPKPWAYVPGGFPWGVSGPISGVFSDGWGRFFLGNEDDGASARIADDYSYSYYALKNFGAEGISRSVNTVPYIPALQILGELREGIPSIPGAQLYETFRGETPVDVSKILKRGSATSDEMALIFRKFGKTVGGEFLNFVFGILPTISDISNIVGVLSGESIKRMQSRLDAQLRAQFKRQRELVNVPISTVDERDTYPSLDGSTIWTVGVGHEVQTITGNRRVWFEGVFDHSPWANELTRSLNSLQATLGANLAMPLVSGLWELVPYSWLVDWFLGVGRMLNNVSIFQREGLAMPYGYVMAETSASGVDVWTGPVGGHPYRAEVTFHSNVKQRLRASPFGFGVKSIDLTAMQNAILAALGLSRLSLFNHPF